MIETASPLIRKRLVVPPIMGRGWLKTFQVALHDEGVTRTFMVAAFSTAQAAELLRCSEIYLKRYRSRPTESEREHAEATPGQVWVRSPGAVNFIKWAAQTGATWI